MQEILSKTRFAGFLIWNKKSGSALLKGDRHKTSQGWFLTFRTDWLMTRAPRRSAEKLTFFGVRGIASEAYSYGAGQKKSGSAFGTSTACSCEDCSRKLSLLLRSQNLYFLIL
jgi:hypothetical protein